MGSIYKIINTVNGMAYIGKSVNDPVKTRINPHLKGYGGSKSLSEAVKEYGKSKFSWEILHDNIDDELLDSYEIEAIMKHNTFAPSGYNRTRGGDGAGRHPSYRKPKKELTDPVFNTARFRRACRGVRQKDLAPVLQIHTNNVSTFLKNLHRIKLADFLKICKFLDEDPNRFIEREPQ